MWICFECVYILHYSLQFKQMKRECEIEKGNEELYFSCGYVRIVETLESHPRNKVYKIFFTEFYNTSFPPYRYTIYIIFKHRLITDF